MHQRHPTGPRRMPRPSRWRRAAWLAIVLASIGLAIGQESGYIEIRGANVDGAEVFLDGTSQGEIEDGVLLISTVYPAQYVLRVEREGLFPMELTIDVAPGQVTAVQLGAASPNPSARTEPRRVGAVLDAATASFTLQCFPMACSLAVLDGPDHAQGGTAFAEFEKEFGDALLIVDDLPTGEYRLEVRGPEGASVTFETGICHDETVAILADFTRVPIDLTFTVSQFPSCPPLPVQNRDTADAPR